MGLLPKRVEKNDDWGGRRPRRRGGKRVAQASELTPRQARESREKGCRHDICGLNGGKCQLCVKCQPHSHKPGRGEEAEMTSAVAIGWCYIHNIQYHGPGCPECKRAR